MPFYSNTFEFFLVPIFFSLVLRWEIYSYFLSTKVLFFFCFLSDTKGTSKVWKLWFLPSNGNFQYNYKEKVFYDQLFIHSFYLGTFTFMQFWILYLFMLKNIRHWSQKARINIWSKIFMSKKLILGLEDQGLKHK